MGTGFIAFGCCLNVLCCHRPERLTNTQSKEATDLMSGKGLLLTDRISDFLLVHMPEREAVGEEI